MEKKVFELSQDELDVIATYMDDDIRESVAFDLSPCTPNQFLREYVSRDEHFEELLKSEFGIETYVKSDIIALNNLYSEKVGE